MKKLFFAAALTAGLLSSCSNDEVAPVANVDGPEAGLAEVKLALNSPSVDVAKRSIGTVGDLAGEAGNKWNGETLYLYMMDKERPADNAQGWNATKWSYYQVTDGVVSTSATEITNFDNAAITTPTDGTTALDFANLTDKGPKYYPNSGTSNFFAYHVDDAYKVLGSEVAPVPTNELDVDGNVMRKVLPISINGSQDLMVGKAVSKAELPEGITEDNLFSAKSARAGVIPNIVMQHLLTRFTFTVQGGDDSAENIQVTKIAVKSLKNGNMTVAWFDAAEDSTDKIAWTLTGTEGAAAPADSALMYLQNRTAANTAVTELAPVTIAKDGTSGAFEKQAIGSALMVAPGGAEYEVYVTLRQTYNDNDVTDDPVGETTIMRKVVINKATVAEGSTADATAKAGSSYAVNIKVYGAAEIKLEAELTGWKDGGSIDVDTNE